jgi:hypothetical protein
MTTPPTFVSGAILTAAQMNSIGMWKISTTSLTAVTNNISNCFSSDYANYRVLCTNMNNASGTTRALTLRFRTTSDDTTAQYNSFQLGVYSSTVFGSSAVLQTSATLGATAAQVSGSASLGFCIDILSPNTATGTTYMGTMLTYQSDITNYVQRTISGNMTTSTQYTGFSIIGVTDALSGTVQVYGYN